MNATPTPDQNIEQLDALFDLIDQKIHVHHLKPKFIADCKAAILALVSEARINEIYYWFNRYSDGRVGISNQLPVTKKIITDRIAELKQTPPTPDGDEQENYGDSK